MKKTQNNLRDNLKKLSDIVSWFESESELDLEKALEQVKIGAVLIKESKERIKDIENQFREIKKTVSE